MATDIDNLKAARTKILEALATNAGKPNYNIDGQQVSYDTLLDRLTKLNDMIAAFEGPFEVATQYNT